MQAANQNVEAKPLIVVTGATGLQGGSVIEYLLNDGGYRVRGLCRHTDKPRARELAARGVEIVGADLRNSAEMSAALQGANGLFLITQPNFGAKDAEEDEKLQAQNALTAAASARVGHVVLSALPGARAITGGAIAVPHMDAKWWTAGQLRQLGLSHTVLLVPFYFQNFGTFFQAREGNDGVRRLSTGAGGGTIAMVNADEVGAVVLPIFKNAEKYNGKIVDVVADEYSTEDAARALSRKEGHHIVASDVDPDAFARFGFQGAEDFGNMFRIFNIIHREREKNTKNPYESLGVKSDDLLRASKITAQKLSSLEQFFLNPPKRRPSAAAVAAVPQAAAVDNGAAAAAAPVPPV